MSHFSFRTVSYRLWRLRRLIVVAALPPLILMAVLGALELPHSLFGTAAGQGVMVAWLGLVCLHVLRFPNGWMETLALSLTVCILVLSEPVLPGLLFGPVLSWGEMALLGAAYLLGGFAILMMMTLVVCGLVGGTTDREVVNVVRRVVPLPRAALFDALALAPDQHTGRKSTGPADEEGFFDVSIRHSCPDRQTFENAPFDVTFRAQVVPSEDGTHQAVIREGNGQDMLVSVTSLRLTPAARGTLVEIAETCNRYNRMMILGFWMQDMMEDYLTDVVDFLRDRPARSVRAASHDTLMTSVAGWMTRQGLATPQD